jgi:hypothetical protein
MNANTPAPLIFVFDGNSCLGFIIACGREVFEAIDADDRNLGKFQNANDAADAVRRATALACPRCGE